MKRTSHHLLRSAILFTFAALLLTPAGRAETVEQEVDLLAGWNAVWLEVEPTYAAGDMAGGVPLAAGDSLIGTAKAPEDVFPTQVLTVLSPKTLAGTAEFFAADPANVTTFNQDSWEVWRRSNPVNDNTLTRVSRNRAYLVESSGPITIMVEGQVRFFRPKWNPDRYNLIGFGLSATPSFDEFFGPSGGRHGATLGGQNRIFRLNPANGNWEAAAGTDAMAPNEAYWIFSRGPSDYMGPVAVTFNGAMKGKLEFGGPSDVVTVDTGADAIDVDLKELVFTNLNAAGADAEPELDLITAAAGSGELALHVVKPVPASLAWDRGNQIDTSEGFTGSPSDLDEPVAPQTSAILTIGAQRLWSIGAPSRTNIYRIRTGAGSAFWLPVSARNNDVPTTADLDAPTEPGSVAGLWVGEVNVNGVSSFVENGAPIRPASAPAPIRLLLHSDGGGAVRLLSQVTIMQTSTADPDVSPVPVLVVDPTQIPFFEGVRERNGKRVGIRLEAVAFDMPRDITIAAQSNPTITLTGCTTTINQTNVSTASTAGLVPGMTVIGTNLAPNTIIVSITNAANFVIGTPATGSGASLTFVASNDVLDMIVGESTSPVTNWLSGQGLYPNRASVTEDAIDSYLLFRGIRPPKLKDVYHLSLPVAGALGAGKTVQTNTDTLVLDGFHRANPFRHAFHQQHPKGPKITRELVIVFDAEQPVPDRLRGSYQEDILGLTKSRLTLTGAIELHRLSPVPTLEGAQ